MLNSYKKIFESFLVITNKNGYFQAWNLMFGSFDMNVESAVPSIQISAFMYKHRHRAFFILNTAYSSQNMIKEL